MVTPLLSSDGHLETEIGQENGAYMLHVMPMIIERVFSNLM